MRFDCSTPMKWLSIASILTAVSLLASCKEETPTDPGGDEPYSLLYTFTSGILEDGFDWPASMVDDTPSTQYTNPDGVTFFHDIGNLLFIDANTLLPDDAAVGNGIDGECLWGNPHPRYLPVVPTVYIVLPANADSVSFDFACVLGGELPPDSLSVSIGDAPGAGWVTFNLTDSWNAGAPYQNSFGTSGRIAFSVESLAADHDHQIAGIRYLGIFVDMIADEGNNGAFAIDNFMASRD